jgi:outer membrane lipopolysaccharide assembly protein LptE/RlpB
MRDAINAMRSRAVQAGTVMMLLLTLSGCGYSLAGRGSSLPPTIKTIAVPLFTNTTSFFDLEQTITQRVRLELISRGKFKVVPDPTGTDAVLTGEITSLTINPTSFTSDQRASRYAFTLIMKVEFRDLKTNKVIYDNPALSFRDEYEVTTATNSADKSAFLGSNSEALERMTNDFARSVVSSILEAF